MAVRDRFDELNWMAKFLAVLWESGRRRTSKRMRVHECAFAHHDKAVGREVNGDWHTE